MGVDPVAALLECGMAPQQVGGRQSAKQAGCCFKSHEGGVMLGNNA
jgi:hypothetical protein